MPRARGRGVGWACASSSSMVNAVRSAASARRLQFRPPLRGAVSPPPPPPPEPYRSPAPGSTAARGSSHRSRRGAAPLPGGPRGLSGAAPVPA